MDIVGQKLIFVFVISTFLFHFSLATGTDIDEKIQVTLQASATGSTSVRIRWLAGELKTHVNAWILSVHRTSGNRRLVSYTTFQWNVRSYTAKRLSPNTKYRVSLHCLVPAGSEQKENYINDIAKFVYVTTPNKTVKAVSSGSNYEKEKTASKERKMDINEKTDQGQINSDTGTNRDSSVPRVVRPTVSSRSNDKKKNSALEKEHFYVTEKTYQGRINSDTVRNRDSKVQRTVRPTMPPSTRRLTTRSATPTDDTPLSAHRWHAAKPGQTRNSADPSSAGRSPSSMVEAVSQNRPLENSNQTSNIWSPVYTRGSAVRNPDIDVNTRRYRPSSGTVHFKTSPANAGPPIRSSTTDPIEPSVVPKIVAKQRGRMLWWIYVVGGAGFGLIILLSALTLLCYRPWRGSPDIQMRKKSRQQDERNTAVVPKIITEDETEPDGPRYVALDNSPDVTRVVPSVISWGSEFDALDGPPENIYTNTNIDHSNFKTSTKNRLHLPIAGHGMFSLAKVDQSAVAYENTDHCYVNTATMSRRT